MSLFNRIPGSVCVFLFLSINLSWGQQRSAESVTVNIGVPKYEKGEGPSVYIDAIHNNFHTADGRFAPFSLLATKDGYNVSSLTSYDQMKQKDILVISNPIHRDNVGNWRQPIHSAFTIDEVKKLTKWVYKGGSLLLIADHMPFSGAASELARSFGFEYCDGFARLVKDENEPDIFSSENGRLLGSPISPVSFDDNNSRILSITTFTGSSFTIPEKAIPVLRFLKGDRCLQPEVAWQFDENTPEKDLAESYQGALLEYGKGKIAVFGEAAMFTAQTVTNDRGTFHFGFNSPHAPNNIEFIRNVLFWLSTESK